VCYLAPNFSLVEVNLDYLAQSVVERAFVQVMATLIVALTFGIAVPVVGCACAVAAFVQFLHHRQVLDQLVYLGHLEQPAVVPNIMGCIGIPVTCLPVLVITVVLVWVCGAIDFLEPAAVAVTFISGLIVALGLCGVVAWWQRSRMKAQQYRARSSAPSDTFQGMLMESLLLEDDIAK